MVSETVQVNLSFRNTLPAWMGVGAVGAVLVAAVLATITIYIGWASATVGPGSQGMAATYTLTNVDLGVASLDYGEFDDGGPTGLITTTYVLAIVGLAFGFLAIPILLAGTLMEGAVMRIMGTAIAGVAAITLILAAVLGPIGIRQFHDDTFGGGSFSLGAGFVLAIIAALFAVVATVAALLSLRSAPAET